MGNIRGGAVLQIMAKSAEVAIMMVKFCVEEIAYYSNITNHIGVCPNRTDHITLTHHTYTSLVRTAHGIGLTWVHWT
jgi:hypothetical protein